jgi:ribosomal protein S12 methylthiotransferase RimO
VSATAPLSRSGVQPGEGRRVALVTLGCARNEVDSEELAGRLADDGWQVTTDPGSSGGRGADVVLVNTCGFVASAKRESIDTLLAAADTGAPVVAAGCLAERYGRELAGQLPEAAAVLSFDDYPRISERLAAVLAGETLDPHTPRDRRQLLPLAPVARPGAGVAVPGHGTRAPARPPVGLPVVDRATPAHLRPVLGPEPGTVLRRRLEGGPVAALKLASGCDRRCAFCAIPTFRGAFVSRTPDELLAEAQWLAGTGVRELVLVSENSTSYGKDLGDPRALEVLLPQLAAVPGIVRVRVSYLQPAELRPGLVEVIATTPGVAPYFDLSFQHASQPVLRRMRRFGSTERFLALLDEIRRASPEAGTRSNVIVGFPGETRGDVSELIRFLEAARLDAVGVFEYSDEDGTEAAGLPDKLAAATVRRRYGTLLGLAEELCAQRAAERVGSTVEVLVDAAHGEAGGGDGGGPVGGIVEGRAAHQAPEVDGSTTLVGPGLAGLRPGDLVGATVVRADGIDLVAVPVEVRPGGSVSGPAATEATVSGSGVSGAGS